METKLNAFAEHHYATSGLVENLRRCVHCGFCNATCPTYQVWGDELDGPRGRLYQIKMAVEGERVSPTLVTHLDQCLTCRACETTCPSGVEYARVLEVGRDLIERQRLRSWSNRLLRRAMVWFLNQRALLRVLVPLGRWFGGVPTHARLTPVTTAIPTPQSTVIFINPCVQDVLAPDIDAAAARIVERLGGRVVKLAASGCCGALAHHLSDRERAQEQARCNIDAWWPVLTQANAEIVVSASGCAVAVKEYGELLKADRVYAERALRVSQACVDLTEWVSRHWPAGVAFATRRTVAFQSPCSLQHGQKLKGQWERFLTHLGLEVKPVPDGHLCCGSAGSYSILNPSVAQELKRRKLHALSATGAEVVLTANIGCYHHLKPDAPQPLWHWAQWLDAHWNELNTP